MATFDPDAYLASKPFDPDAYLAQAGSNATPKQQTIHNSTTVYDPVSGVPLYSDDTSGEGATGTTKKVADALRTVAAAPVAFAAGAGRPLATIARALPGSFGKDMSAAQDQIVKGLGQATDSKYLMPGMELAGQVAGTAGIGGLMGKGAAAIPAISRFAPALSSGGFNLGGAATNSALANAAIRAGAGSAVGYAGAGLINPDDANTGAILGGAIPLIGQASNAFGRVVGSGARTATEDAIIQKAKAIGMPLGLGDVSKSKVIQATKSILKDAPITGGMARGSQEAKQVAYNKAIGAQMGLDDAQKITLEVIDQAKGKTGAELDRIWGGNTLNVSPDMVNRMNALDEVAAKLPRNEGGSLSAEIRDLYSKMKPNENGELFVPGDVANKFQSYLRRRAESTPGLSNELTDLRRSIIDTFNKSVTNPADAAALTKARSEWKAIRTVEPLIRKTEAGVAGREAGNVPAALFPSEVARSYKSGPMYDLAQIGSQFLVDRTPQTGGSVRAALQNIGIGAGGMAAYGSAGIPGVAAAMGAGIGLQAALQSPAVLKLTQAGMPIPQAIKQASKYGLLSAPVIYPALSQ
jgi:hypothetical protein